jgi:hypothetical protein
MRKKVSKFVIGNKMSIKVYINSTFRLPCRAIINLHFKSNDESFSYLGVLYAVLVFAFSSRIYKSNCVYCSVNDSEYVAPNSCTANSERERMSKKRSCNN